MIKKHTSYSGNSRKVCPKAAKKIDLLDSLLTSLQSVRRTAQSNDFEFLSYLTEMAALEAQREIHLAGGADKKSEVSEE